MVETGVGKALYNIELVLIKIIPYILMFCYILNTILAYYNIDAPILAAIGGLSIFPWIFLFVSSFVFRFCIYHRLPLYYILISEIIAYYDLYFGIPINDRSLFSINLSIIGLFLLLIVFFKFKQHE